MSFENKNKDPISGGTSLDQTLDPAEIQKKSLNQMRRAGDTGQIAQVSAIESSIDGLPQDDRKAILSIMELNPRSNTNEPNEQRVHEWYETLKSIQDELGDKAPTIELEAAAVKGFYSIYPDFVYLSPRRDIYRAFSAIIKRIKMSGFLDKHSEDQKLISYVLKDIFAASGVHTSRELNVVKKRLTDMDGAPPIPGRMLEELMRTETKIKKDADGNIIQQVESSILNDMVDRALMINEAEYSTRNEATEMIKEINARIPEGLPKLPHSRVRVRDDGRVLVVGDQRGLDAKMTALIIEQGPQVLVNHSVSTWKFEDFKIDEKTGKRFYLLSKVGEGGNVPGGIDAVLYVKQDGTLDDHIYDYLSEFRNSSRRSIDHQTESDDLLRQAREKITQIDS